MPDPNETLTDMALDVDEKDIKTLFIKISYRLEKRFDTIDTRFDTVDSRLKKGDETMTALKSDIAEINSNIKELPCKISNASDCNDAAEPKEQQPSSKTFAMGFTAAITTIFIGFSALFEFAKPIWETIKPLIFKEK